MNSSYKVSTSTLRVMEQFQYGSIICGEIELKMSVVLCLNHTFLFFYIKTLHFRWRLQKCCDYLLVWKRWL